MINARNNARKIITASIAAVTLGVTIAATSSPAEARWGRNGAFFGGLAVGALAVGALGASSYAYGPSYGGCYFDRRAVTDGWGIVIGYRRVRVCN